MKKTVPETVITLFMEVSKSMKSADFHVSQAPICDCCRKDGVEAFPYNVTDMFGNRWTDLCNECFEDLGCSYPFEPEARG